MLIKDGLFIISGLFLLYQGSEWIVDSASSLAVSFSIKPIIIGLTIVAFATSAPELLVSLTAAYKGSGGVSIGNIIGSNIINIALVIGCTAILKPIEINKESVRFELPFMIFVSALFWIMCIDGKLGRIDGIILLFILAFFLLYGILNAKANIVCQSDIKTNSKKSILKDSFFIILGLIGLALGADLTVKGAIGIATEMGLSELFIGMSIVAMGTSLPELTTSLIAIKKGKNEISLGNVVGSNLFNICMVMGIVGVLNPIPIAKKLNYFEFPAMIFISLMLLIFSKIEYKITKKHGYFFISCFVIFLYVIIKSG